MKKTLISILIISTFIFTGCFGGGDNTDSTSDNLQNFTTYNAPAFSVGIPSEWEIVEQKDFASNIPSSTLVIFRDNIKNSTFTANANISREIIKSPITTLDYAKSIITDNKDNLKNYEEISRDQEHKIAIAGELKDTILIMFEGKEKESDPLIRIIQTFAVDGTEAYTITAAYLKESDEITVEYAKNIVKSFKIK